MLKNPASVAKLKELFYNDIRDAIRKLKGSPGFDDTLAMRLLGNANATVGDLVDRLVMDVKKIFDLI